jgi:hypothetical protein
MTGDCFAVSSTYNTVLFLHKCSTKIEIQTNPFFTTALIGAPPPSPPPQECVSHQLACCLQLGPCSRGVKTSHPCSECERGGAHWNFATDFASKLFQDQIRVKKTNMGIYNINLAERLLCAPPWFELVEEWMQTTGTADN